MKVVELKQDKFKALVEEFLREIDTSIEYYQGLARLRKAVYDAHLEQGFSESDAFYFASIVCGEGACYDDHSL